MSNDIYFNTKKKFRLRRRLVNAGTRFHHTVAPSHARKTARKLLLTPVRSKSKNSEPQKLIKGSLNTSEGKIITYRLGTGPVWVLTHGWSGTASQFYPLMQHIASRGFTALAYDHPAHGESEGQLGHLPGFRNAFNELLDSLDSVAGVVAHSMGTASTLESHHEKLENVPLLLIAPVLNYIESLYDLVNKSGYSMKLFQEIVDELESSYHYPLHSINPYQHLLLRTATTIIVHDRRDKFTSFAVSESAANSSDNITLIATQGQGHGRIMHSHQVMAAFDQLTAKEIPAADILIPDCAIIANSFPG